MFAEFKEGTTYKVCGSTGKTITVTKRTPCYLTFTGDFEGRRMIDKTSLFGQGENIIVGSGHFTRFVFAADIQ